MKRRLGTVSKSLAHGFAAVLTCSVVLVSVAGAAADAIVQTTASISYVSGGVGTASIDRLNSLAKDFNVKLVFALRSGPYLSDVRVAIGDAKGKMLLETRSEGPWFLARLAAGDYQIVATFAGKEVQQRISVGAGSLRTLDFRWDSE